MIARMARAVLGGEARTSDIDRVVGGSEAVWIDLRRRRLEAVLTIALIQVVGAAALVLLPIDPLMVGVGWAGVSLIAVAMAAALLYSVRPWLGGVVLIAGLFSCWTASLWIYPPEIVVWQAVLIVGVACIIFGAPAAFSCAALATLAIGISAWAGYLPLGLAMSSSIVIWGGSFLWWLPSRPLVAFLDWAWRSFADARESRDQLRQRQAELSQVLKSLDLACQRLEHLNTELSRAHRSAEEARRLKNAFAANISHELRTPLNLILGFSEMMVTAPRVYGDWQLPPTYQADLDAIYRNAQHLAGLIDDVLDLSQIDADRLGLVRDRTELSSIIDEAIQVVGVRFRNLGLTLEVKIAAGLPAVLVDRTRIRQILINLLNNAARFTDHGGIRVVVERRANEIVTSVIDTGVGIEPEDLSRIFDEFYQANSTNQRHAGGSGLGLAVSRRLVELHGGTMWVESQPGAGSTFSFSLPLTDNILLGSLPSDWAAWDRSLQDRPAGKPALALLASDESVIRSFRRHLDSYQIIPTSNDQGLVSLIRDTPIRGLIIARMTAAECWKALSQLPDCCSGLPVALFAGSGWQEQAAWLGVTDYIAKPISREQVGRVLARLGETARTILVVDDSIEMVRLLARSIKSFGAHYRVWQATSGQEALAILRERHPDAIMLDLLMPAGDGESVLDAAHADDQLRQIPIVVVSARDAREDARAVSLVGITRSGGMAPSEAIQYLKGSLEALAAESTPHSDSLLPEDLDGLPALGGSLRPPENVPTRSLG